MKIQLNNKEKEERKLYYEVYGDWANEAQILHHLYTKMGQKDMMYLIQKYQKEAFKDPQSEPYCLTPNHRIKTLKN